MIRAAVIGATGYTGAELIRLLIGHPAARVACVVGHRSAGEPVHRVMPSLAGLLEGDVLAFDPQAIAEAADVAFCALPHGASAEKVKLLRQVGLPVFDLSADFRLSEVDTYRSWYGEHPAPEMIADAVYGLPELHREALSSADLVAVPGCYPTATTLAAAPILSRGWVRLDAPIVVDAKSGVSGAGRSPSPKTHLPEAAEGLRAYAVGGAHRHTPEIEQVFSEVAGRDVRVIFTPHLVPMTRGLLSTVYLPPAGEPIDPARATEHARAFYEGSPAVHVLDPGQAPDTLWARGANRAFVSYTADPRSGWLIAQCAIDNLVKGAAGQALQCMNLRFGLDEGAGLRTPATWP